MRRKIHHIVFVLFLFGFGSVNPAAADQVVDRIVAIVDAEIVTKVELEREAAPYLKQIESSAGNETQKEQSRQNILNQVLTRLIEISLTQQEARKYQIQVTSQEIDGAVQNVRKNKGLTEEEFEKALEFEGFSMEEYRKDLEGQILRARLINHAVKSKVVVSKASIQKYYDEHQGQYAGVKKYQIGNIVIRNKDRILEVKEKLDQGEPFKILARDYSIAPNAKEGGKLGRFDLSSLPAVIQDGLKGLKPGEYTDVISTARGYQIFYVDDIIHEGARTFEQAYDEIHGILYKKQVEVKFKKWMKSLKEKAHIKTML